MTRVCAADYCRACGQRCGILAEAVAVSRASRQGGEETARPGAARRSADDAGRRHARRRGMLRFGLANARMFSAAVALVLMFSVGLTWLTCAAVLVSFTLSAFSRQWFPRRPRDDLSEP